MIMREIGKAKKIEGYKEIVTYGFHPYKVPMTDARGITKEVEFVATLTETVLDHIACHTCNKYIGKLEEEMSSSIIACKHTNLTENKINERVLTFDCDDCGGTWKGDPDKPYWTPTGTQEYICFECCGDILENESPER